MRSCTNSIDPTSNPRVGWDATSTFTGRESSRAITTFCLFPPESVDTASETDCKRISNSVTRFSASDRTVLAERFIPFA